MKTTSKIIQIIFLTPIVLAIIAYILLAFYYKDAFTYGTWINGIYCTGKTIDEIDAQLCKNFTEKNFSVQLEDSQIFQYSLSDIGYTVSYKESLKTYISNRNIFLWGKSLLVENKKTISPICTYNVDLLEDVIRKSIFYQESLQREIPCVSIQFTDMGYKYIDTMNNILDPKLAMEKIEESLTAGNTNVNLFVLGCYYDLPKSVSDLEKTNLWNKINTFQNFSMCYVFGDDKEVIDLSVVSKWIQVDMSGNIKLDDSGNLILNETALAEYMYHLASLYNTYNVPRQFRATDGRVVTIEKGTYGNSFDVETEIEYLKSAFLNKNTQDRTPEYTKKALYQGRDDVGKTYIEVDLTNQMLYFYKNGVIAFETQIVSGNIATGHSTPQRVCSVYGKYTNRILRGEGYASQVDYWVPVYGGIGIHDAKWRSSFGGTIYKKNGSHGCINIPRENMEDLYTIIEVGTPVFIFY